MVKPSTIKKYVEFLNEFKGLADSNTIINMAALVNKYHINSSIHLHAVKLGYFDRTDENGISGWRCNLVTFFEPYHARKLAEVVNEYNKSPKYKKDNSLLSTNKEQSDNTDNALKDYCQLQYHPRHGLHFANLGEKPPAGWTTICKVIKDEDCYNFTEWFQNTHKFTDSPIFSQQVSQEFNQFFKPTKPLINILFDSFWDLYDKKVGDKQKLEKTWNKLSDKDREIIMTYIPKYKEAQPDKQFRKDPQTFLYNKSWNDEIVSKTYTKIIPSTPVQNNYPLSHYSDQQLWDELKRRGYEGKILKGLE